MFSWLGHAGAKENSRGGGKWGPGHTWRSCGICKTVRALNSSRIFEAEVTLLLAISFPLFFKIQANVIHLFI